MDNSIIDTVMNLLAAAASGATQVATDAITKIGASAVEKLGTVVAGYFTKDGAGASKAIEKFQADPSNLEAQDRVKTRLVEFLKDDPQFAAEIEAIIGEVRTNAPITMTATAGNNGTIVQALGSNVLIR